MDARIVHVLHDEIVVEAKTEIAEEVRDMTVFAYPAKTQDGEGIQADFLRSPICGEIQSG